MLWDSVDLSATLKMVHRSLDAINETAYAVAPGATGLAVGVGFRLNSLTLDYAFLPSKRGE